MNKESKVEKWQFIIETTIHVIHMEVVLGKNNLFGFL